MVAANIEPKYKANVIRAMVEGISNITNMTIGYTPNNQTVDQTLLEQAVPEEVITQRITIAKSLSQVTNLIRADPEIIGQNAKDQLKMMLNSLIGLDTADNILVPKSQSGTTVKLDANDTLKQNTILSSKSIS